MVGLSWRHHDTDLAVVSNRRGSITVGVDIGTTSVKALAVDEKGEVVARSRVAHRVLATEPDQLRHDARRAWRAGPQKAYAQLTEELAATGNGEIAGLAVAAMVPSEITPKSRRTNKPCAMVKVKPMYENVSRTCLGLK